MDVRLADQSIVELEAEVLVAPELEGDEPSPLIAELDARLGGRLARARQYKELTGKPNEALWIHAEGGLPAPRVLVVGLGKREELSVERVRRAFSTAARQLRRREVRRAVVALPAFDAVGPWQWIVPAAADGLVTGDFDGGLYKSDRTERAIESVAIGALAAPRGYPPPAEWADLVRRGVLIGEGVNTARRLAVEPGSHLTPTGLAERARQIGQAAGLEVDVIDQARLEEMRAGALLGVARGSDEPPVMIVLRYRSGRSGGPVLGIVGKGVTFDSGGISIKPAGSMHEMKYDMAGAAATIGAMQAIAALRPNVDAIGVVPATENLLGGRAMKPGDVLRAMSGKTIEVQNTDAEGRLILADALTHAQALGATHLIDAATLTGACVVALGHHASGLFGGPPEWIERVRTAAERSGDRVWPLPTYPEYREQLKSDVADLCNVGGRSGGACVAASFLQAFVDDGVPWAHLDIAGTAYTSSDKPYLASGPTGASTRIFVELALDLGREGSADD